MAKKILFAIVLTLTICLVFVPNLLKNNQDNNQDDIKVTTVDKEFQIAPSVIGDVTITPVSFSKFGVSLDSDFYIDTKIDITEKDLSENISFLADKNNKNNKTNFKITKQKEPNKFLLKLDKPLQTDKIYNVKYEPDDKSPLSFAFQTVSSFKVMATTPAKDQYNVPLNTGIEISFNKELKDGIDNYFSITPDVDGTFTRRDLTYIFVPKDLSPDTSYTVTIDKNLSSIDNEKLEEDYKINFKTQWDKKESVNIFGDKYETFLPTDDIFIELYATGQFADKTYQIDVSKFDDASTFINYQSKKSIIPSKSILTLKTKLFKTTTNSYDNRGFVMLNKTLPVGHYLVQITTEHEGKVTTLDKMIQVHPLSVYSLSKNGEICFWVNDKTKPASNVSINIDGKTIKTDKNGIAIQKLTQTENNTITLKTEEYPEFVYKTRIYDKEEISVSKRYYSYIYTDREVYRNKDTVSVFGVLKQRYEKYPVPKDFTLKIADVVSTNVSIKEDGTFTASIPIEHLENTQYISLALGKDTITSTSAYFSDYVNQTYVMKFSSDKKAYLYNETAKCTINVTTYDGVPVKGVSIAVNGLDDKVITTDEHGNTSFDMTFNDRNNYNTNPYYEQISYNIIDAQNEVEWNHGEVVVVPMDVSIKTKNLYDGKVEVTAKKIDIKKLNELLAAENSFLYNLNEEDYAYEDANITAHFDIFKRVAKKQISSESYDFIEKKYIKNYSYSFSDPILVEPTKNEIKLTNGKYIISNLPAGDTETHYFGKLLFQDFEFDFYWMYDKSMITFNSTHGYYISFDKKDEEEGGYYNSLSVGETANIILKDNNQNIIKEGSLLTITSGNEIYNTTVTNPTDANFKFEEEHINFVNVFGAYFDGKFIHPCYNVIDVTFKSEDRKLNIDMSFDKSAYSPGNEVSANITITDENNKPKKASVLLSVVDESVKRISEPSFLYSFYNSIMHYEPYFFDYRTNYTIYSSYTKHRDDDSYGTVNGGAEKGSEGMESQYIRDDFNDNPAFIQVDTDANGKATAKFKLSDAITSWRVTSLAISKDNYVGDNKNNIISTVPFYLNMVIADTYLLGDNINIIAKPYGTEYKYKQSNIQYEIVVSKNNKTVFTDKVNALDMHIFDCGNLELGDYTATITLKSGQYTDTMSKPFSVVANDMLLPLTKTETLSGNAKLSDLKPSKGNVNVTFSNGSIKELMDILYSCINYESDRTDYKAAAAFSSNYPRKTNDKYYERLKQELSDDYMIKELAYGDPDLLYSARFFVAFPEFITKTDSLISYIRIKIKDIQNNSESNKPTEDEELDIAAYYLMLATLDQNVLLEINDKIELLKTIENKSNKFNKIMMIYAQALAVLGDHTNAYNLAEQYKIDEASFSALEDSQKEYIQTMQLLLDSILKPEKAFETLKKSKNIYVSNVCEKILFLKNATPVGGVSNEFSYNLFDKTETKTLNNFEQLYLTIDKNQFEKLNVLNTKGKTDIRINYSGTVADLDQSKKLIDIKETQSKEGEFGKYRRNFVVNIKPDAPYGYYTIYSRVPSNMRYLADNSYGLKDFWIDDEDQPIIKISFYYSEFNKQVPELYYDMIKISDTKSVQTPSYILCYSYDDIKDYWGMTN